MSELTFINIDERAYKYIRQFTIKTTEDALIELITNVIDAYNKGGVKENRRCEIEFKSPNIIRVRDYAIGLTGEDMIKCFLQVGQFTNTDEARGFFSRGAKDISAIGDILFHGVKDNKYSRVLLNRDAHGMVEINDVAFTEEYQTLTGLKENDNGLLVEIYLLDNFCNFNPSDQAESLSKLGVLRDIMSDSNNLVTYKHINELNNILFDRILTYTYPVGNKLLEIEYNVPGYLDKKATLIINIANDPIKQPKKENELEFGFLVKDSSTVYETSTIDDRFRWKPHMPYIYGSLKCDEIGIMLRDYDKNGATLDNPMPIIDPSRLTGVNKLHPFIDALFSIPKVRIDKVLRELNTNIATQSISLEEMGDIMKELEKYGLDFIDNEDIKVDFIPNYDSNLVKAIEDDRNKYITSEKSYMLTNNYSNTQTLTDQYIKEQIIKISLTDENIYNNAFILDKDENIIKLPADFSNYEEDTINQLNILNDEEISNIKNNPYIYSLNSNGQLVKLYIYEKGHFEKITNPENDYLIIKNKKFQILFINDINLKSRYLIDYTDGVKVKLNTNDTLIQKYLIGDIENINVDMSVSNLTSTKSLMFLKDLMIEVFADVILQADIMNNIIVLDSSTINNTQKIFNHRNEIIDRIEDPIDAIFDVYLQKNTDQKRDQLNDIIQSISDVITSKINMDENGELITGLRKNLEYKITELIE